MPNVADSALSTYIGLNVSVGVPFQDCSTGTWMVEVTEQQTSTSSTGAVSLGICLFSVVSRTLCAKRC